MRINDPETVAELQALYPQYETALVTNDVEALTRLFWPSPHAMRFGVTENLHGFDEIAAFRAARPPVNLARTVRRLDIVTFGRDFASITLEFERQHPRTHRPRPPDPDVGALAGRLAHRRRPRVTPSLIASAQT